MRSLGWRGASASSALLASIASLAACAPASPPVWPSPDPVTFARLRDRLTSLRVAAPARARPWSAVVRVSLREPRGGRVVEGRGGLAVAPGRALRMILVGGAGSTMLDVWVSSERYRVAVPALDLVRRGRGGAADLPVAFLRWWFLEPLGGRLFAATESEAGGRPAWLLRDDGGVVELREAPCERGEGLRATRRTPPALHEGAPVAGQAERVLACVAGTPSPSVGDRADYEDLASGLTLHVEVESVSATAPPDDAFVDPDAPPIPPPAGDEHAP